MPRIVVPMASSDDVSAVADQQLIVEFSLLRDDLIELFQQRLRIDDDAGGDDRCNAFVQNSGRQERKFVGFAIKFDGVPRVIAAEITDYDIVLTGQKVDDFSLGFVTPLQTDNGCRTHDSLS
jgi:hypothetical protein